MAGQLYVTQDGVLARERAGYAPEVYAPASKSWHPYPQLDTLHDARAVTEDHARELLGDDVPDSPMGDLTSTGETGNAGDIYESARAPVRVPRLS